MMKKIIAGIIGSGFAAHLRVNALKKIPGDRINIKGIYDTSHLHAKEFSSEINASVYESFEELLEDEIINTIIVCVPNKYHYKIVKDALEKGKNIICEYPLIVDDYKEAEELIDLAYRKKLYLHVGQTMNHDEEKGIILKNKNTLGKVLMGYKYMSFGELGSWFGLFGFKGDYKNLGNWYIDKKRSGSWFVAAHYHGIHIFRKVFGEVRSIYAVDSSTPEVAAGTILMKHDNGSSSSIQWGMPILGKTYNFTLISGSDGSIEIDGEEYHIHTSGESRKGKFKGIDPFYEDCRSIIKELDGKKDFKKENIDMLKTLKVSISAERSSIENKVIDIK